MGFTHYWYRPKTLKKDIFLQAVEDCKKICQALPIPLGNWAGKGKPKFASTEICFNGHAKSGQFSRDGGGLLWPTDNAESAASVGENAINGQWCAGPMVEARCVDENGDVLFLLKN